METIKPWPTTIASPPNHQDLYFFHLVSTAIFLGKRTLFFASWTGSAILLDFRSEVHAFKVASVGPVAYWTVYGWISEDRSL